MELIFGHLLTSSNYSATKKIINPVLTEKQKDIMFNEATERPYSSLLNHEKRKGFLRMIGYKQWRRFKN